MALPPVAWIRLSVLAWPSQESFVVVAAIGVVGHTDHLYKSGGDSHRQSSNSNPGLVQFMVEKIPDRPADDAGKRQHQRNLDHRFRLHDLS